MLGLLVFVALATPALAAQKKHSRNANSQEAYAQAQQWQTQRHSTNPRFDVYQNGEYVGSDPDPMVRFELQRDNVDATANAAIASSLLMYPLKAAGERVAFQGLPARICCRTL